MSDFLESCTFLTDTQRQVLRDQDMDSPSAFKHVTLARLEAPPFGFTPGRASKLLDAAGAGGSSPMTVVHQNAEPVDVSVRIDRALQAAHDDVSKAGTLADLGVVYVVLQADDRIDVAATKAMRAHSAAGAPVGVTWHGQRIAEAARMATPPIWCSPRTGQPLQAGKDELTDIAWGELKIDGLRLAAFGFREGIFANLADEVVFERLQKNTGGIREKLADRMKALAVTAESMDSVVVFQAQAPSRWAEQPIANPRPRAVTSGSLVGNVANLLASMLSDGEIRRLAHAHGGDSLSHNLPGDSASLGTIAFEAASTMQRYGLLNRGLRDRLVNLRPRRVDEIDAVFSAAGLV